MHLGIILINNQRDAQFFFVYVYFDTLHVLSNPVFIIIEQRCANHQENQLYQYDIWHMSLYVGDICQMSYWYNWFPWWWVRGCSTMMSTWLLQTHHHHHVSVMEMGHLLTRSGLMYPEVSSMVCHDSFCQSGNSVSLPWVIYYEAFYLHVVSIFFCTPVICPKLVLFLTPLQFVL